MAIVKKPKRVKVQNSLAATHNALYLDFHLEAPKGGMSALCDFYEAYMATLKQKQFDNCTYRNIDVAYERERWVVYANSAKLAMKLSQKARDLANKYGLTLHNVPKPLSQQVHG